MPSQRRQLGMHWPFWQRKSVAEHSRPAGHPFSSEPSWQSLIPSQMRATLMQLPSLAHVNSFIKQLANAPENWTLCETTMLRALVRTNRESRAAGMADMTILVLLWQLVLSITRQKFDGHSRTQKTSRSDDDIPANFTLSKGCRRVVTCRVLLLPELGEARPYCTHCLSLLASCRRRSYSVIENARVACV